VVIPSKLHLNFTGLLLGIALIYLLILVRISVLYFVLAFQPDWFLLIHSYLAPTLMVIVGYIYFSWWAFSETYTIHESA
jgi:exosortase family protein XrtM